MTMLANELTPFCPTHPGEILKDEVEYRKISQRALARQMGISYSQLNEVLNGKRPVNTELALLFEAALGLDPEMLLNMQTRYNMQVARADQRTQDRWNEVRKLVCIVPLMHTTVLSVIRRFIPHTAPTLSGILLRGGKYLPDGQPAVSVGAEYAHCDLTLRQP